MIKNMKYFERELSNTQKEILKKFFGLNIAKRIISITIETEEPTYNSEFATND
jgi:hypothetical protein